MPPKPTFQFGLNLRHDKKKKPGLMGAQKKPAMMKVSRCSWRSIDLVTVAASLTSRRMCLPWAATQQHPQTTCCSEKRRGSSSSRRHRHHSAAFSSAPVLAGSAAAGSIASRGPDHLRLRRSLRRRQREEGRARRQTQFHRRASNPGAAAEGRLPLTGCAEQEKPKYIQSLLVAAERKKVS